PVAVLPVLLPAAGGREGIQRDGAVPLQHGLRRVAGGISVTAHLPTNITWRGLTAIVALTVAMEAGAQNYIASEIPREDAGSVLYEDMDGDGRSDVIVPAWSQEAGRELLVYLQQADGRFPSQPSRRVEIKPEIIAIGLADLRPEPGKEVLLFTSSA